MALHLYCLLNDSQGRVAQTASFLKKRVVQTATARDTWESREKHVKDPIQIDSESFIALHFYCLAEDSQRRFFCTGRGVTLD